MRNRETTAPVVGQRAKELRGCMTRAEVVVWQRLRAKQMCGLRFRRQEPVGNFVADFYCAAARLVVELDGDSHSERAENDAQRDAVLRNEGCIVLRFNNELIFNNLASVLETIAAHCASSSPSKHRTAIFDALIFSAYAVLYCIFTNGK